MDYRDARITVMGLGRFGGGAAAARFLAERGARVTVTDTADEASLAASLTALRDVPIARTRLGGHEERDFADVDLVIVNPAVRPGHPLIALARQGGARIVTEIELFIDECREHCGRSCEAVGRTGARDTQGPTLIGVTGSNGKSTTAAMTAAIVRASGRPTWLGGNIGGSLLGQIERIGGGDCVVLEMSSFQLHWLAPRFRMPHVAIVTSFAPNHLDWHGSLDAYAAAKQRLLQEQRPDDCVVLDADDPALSDWLSAAIGRVVSPIDDLQIPPLRVPGTCNRQNARLAAAAARAIGCDGAALAAGLAAFGGLPHRLEWKAVIDGRRCYDDSSATTPESTAAAIGMLAEPAWFLIGGRDKGCDFRAMLAALGARARGAAFFGECGAALAAALRHSETPLPDDSAAAFATLDEALAWCFARSKPGEAIVLSPACASSAPYRNFVERGEHFAALLQSMAGAIWS